MGLPIEKNDGQAVNQRQYSLGDSFNYYRGHEFYARNKGHILIKNQHGLKGIDAQNKTLNDYQLENLPEVYRPLLKVLNEVYR